MTLYVTLFGGEVTSTEKYGPARPGEDGTVKRAEYTVGGNRRACIDGPMTHGLTFTPSASPFVGCRDEAEFNAA